MSFSKKKRMLKKDFVDLNEIKIRFSCIKTYHTLYQTISELNMSYDCFESFSSVNIHSPGHSASLLGLESNYTKRKMKESLLVDWYQQKKDMDVYSQKSFILNVF
jgi:hypothetical protein